MQKLAKEVVDMTTSTLRDRIADELQRAFDAGISEAAGVDVLSLKQDIEALTECRDALQKTAMDLQRRCTGQARKLAAKWGPERFARDAARYQRGRLIDAIESGDQDVMRMVRDEISEQGDRVGWYNPRLDDGSGQSKIVTEEDGSLKQGSGVRANEIREFAARASEIMGMAFAKAGFWTTGWRLILHESRQVIAGAVYECQLNFIFEYKEAEAVYIIPFAGGRPMELDDLDPVRISEWMEAIVATVPYMVRLMEDGRIFSRMIVPWEQIGGWAPGFTNGLMCALNPGTEQDDDDDDDQGVDDPENEQ